MGTRKRTAAKTARSRKPAATPDSASTQLPLLDLDEVLKQAIANAPAPSLHVVGVRGTVKGGVACRLAPHTLLIGDNSSGKSAVVNTIELALSARASDIAGRDLVAKEAELLELGDPSGLVFAEVALSDGQRASFRCSAQAGARKGIHSLPSVVNPARVFPLRAVREAIRGSADTARQFFLRHTAGRITLADVHERLDVPLRPLMDAVGLTPREPPAPGAETVDLLLGSLEEAKRRARAAASESKVAAKLVDASASALPPEPTREMLMAVADRVQRAQSITAAVAQAATLGDAPTRRDGTIAEGRALLARLAEVQRELAALPAENAATAFWWRVAEAQRFFIAALDLASNPAQACPCCGAADAGAAIMARHTEIAQSIQVASVASARRAELSAETVRIQNRMGTLKAVHDELEERIRTAVQAPQGVTIEQARAELEAASRTHAELLGLKGQWEIVRREKSVSTGAGQASVDWKLLAKKLAEVVRGLLDTAKADFVRRVQVFLPDTDVFGIEVEDSLRLGLVRNDRLHTALAGAEWARVTLAVAAAITVGDAGALSILIPEDRAWHPRSLTRVLTVLARSPHQVILAHPTVGEVPSGWWVIDTEKGEHLTCAQEWGTAP